MTDSVDLDLGRRSRRLRVDTLVKLRWLAVFGQLAAVLLVRFGLGFPIPLSICLLFIAGSAWLNIVLSLRYDRSDRLDDKPAAAILAYDIVQLAALLRAGGGVAMPATQVAAQRGVDLDDVDDVAGRAHDVLAARQRRPGDGSGRMDASIGF